MPKPENVQKSNSNPFIHCFHMIFISSAIIHKLNKNMVEMGKVENLFWGSVFLFNWWTIVRAIVEICREWSNGIAYELLEMSLLIAINGVIAENYRTIIERKRI